MPHRKQTAFAAIVALALLCAPITPALAHPAAWLFGRHLIGGVLGLAALPLTVASVALSAASPPAPYEGARPAPAYSAPPNYYAPPPSYYAPPPVYYPRAPAYYAPPPRYYAPVYPYSRAAPRFYSAPRGYYAPPRRYSGYYGGYAPRSERSAYPRR